MFTIYVLLGAILVVFGITVRVGGARALLKSYPPAVLVRLGASYQPLLRRGQWWRLGTSPFLHASIEHLAANSFALWQVGKILSPFYPQETLVLLYAVSAVTGGLVSLAWRWNQPERRATHSVTLWRVLLLGGRYGLATSVGASGAISGLMGAGVVHALMTHDSELAIAMGQWLAIVLGYGLAPNVNNAAHVGGMLGGGLTTWVIERADLFAPPPGSSLAALPLLLMVATCFALAYVNRDRSPMVSELFSRGLAKTEQKDFRGAIPDFEAALALYPPNPVAQYNIAFCHFQLSEWEACVSASVRTAALDPSYPAYALWADALEKLGRADEAAATRARRP